MLLNVVRFCAFIVALCCAAVHPACAEPLHTPKSGSTERRAILDALRVPVQAEVKRNVVFEILRLRVADGWAFVFAIPRQANGKPIDYRGTRFAEQISEGAFDDQVCALLRLREGKWRVLECVIGATDVPWEPWPEEHGAPRALFR